MARIKIENIIPMEAQRYWEINNQLDFEEFQAPRLDLTKYEELERRETNGILHRRIRVEPDIHLPGPVEKLVAKNLGDANFYYEETRDIPLKQGGERLEYEWQIHPPALKDKLYIGGSFIVEPIDDNSCRRILDGEVKVKILGIGGIIEKFAVREISKTYDKIPGVVGAWAKEAD